jgi:hypothetical protein
LSGASGFLPAVTDRFADRSWMAALSSRWTRLEHPMDDTETVEAAAAVERAPEASPPLDALIIIPVRDLVLFPGMVVPIAVGRERSIAAAQRALRDQRQVGIVMQRESGIVDPVATDLYRIGTAANIIRYVTAPDGSHHLVCQGEERFEIMSSDPGIGGIGAAAASAAPTGGSRSIGGVAGCVERSRCVLHG